MKTLFSCSRLARQSDRLRMHQKTRSPRFYRRPFFVWPCRPAVMHRATGSGKINVMPASFEEALVSIAEIGRLEKSDLRIRVPPPRCRKSG